MRRRAAVLAVLLALTAACGGGGGDSEEAEEDPVEETADTTAAPPSDDGADGDEGEDVFADYIEALIGGDYSKAMDVSAGAASNVAGFFSAVSQITSAPAEFKAPSRQIKLHFTGEGATKQGDLTVLNAKVEGAITGGGADENVVYSDIKLQDEDGKLVVVDFTRGGEGPVSEDVLRTSGAKGEAEGIAVEMGPGYAMRGTSEGGTQFANFVFAFTNSRDTEVNIKETVNNKLYNAASLDTASKRYPSDTSAGNAAAPGSRGLGFVYFNAGIPDRSGVLTLRFVDEDDEQIEVDVQLSL